MTYVITDACITVNNSETLLNVYNALFLGKATTTKFPPGAKVFVRQKTP